MRMHAGKARLEPALAARESSRYGLGRAGPVAPRDAASGYATRRRRVVRAGALRPSSPLALTRRPGTLPPPPSPRNHVDPRPRQGRLGRPSRVFAARERVPKLGAKKKRSAPANPVVRMAPPQTRGPAVPHRYSRHTAYPISCSNSPSHAPGLGTAARTGACSSTVSTRSRSTGATNRGFQLYPPRPPRQRTCSPPAST